MSFLSSQHISLMGHPSQFSFRRNHKRPLLSRMASVISFQVAFCRALLGIRLLLLWTTLEQVQWAFLCHTYNSIPQKGLMSHSLSATQIGRFPCFPPNKIEVLILDFDLVKLIIHSVVIENHGSYCRNYSKLNFELFVNWRRISLR